MLGNDTRLISITHGETGLHIGFSRFHNGEIRHSTRLRSNTDFISHASLKRLMTLLEGHNVRRPSTLIFNSHVAFNYHFPPNPAALKEQVSDG